MFSYTLDELYKICMRLYPDEIFQFQLTPLGIRDPQELSVDWIMREFDRRREKIESSFEADLWKLKKTHQRQMDDRVEWRLIDYERLYDWRNKYLDWINGKWEEEDDSST